METLEKKRVKNSESAIQNATVWENSCDNVELPLHSQLYFIVNNILFDTQNEFLFFQVFVCSLKVTF